MYTVCATSQRNIGAIVYQDFCGMGIGKLEHAPHEMGQFARGQILLADLNALDARRKLTRDIRDERIHAT
jgi:hypothetical protein